MEGSTGSVGASASTSTQSAATSTAPTNTQSQTSQQSAQSSGQGQGANSQGTQTSAQTAKTPKQAVKEVRRLGDQDMDALVQVKIGGEVKELPLKEVIRLNQLEQASRQKMNEAAREVKRAQRIIHLLQNDPDALAKELGLDLDRFAEERLAKKYELMTMNEADRRAYELEQELNRYKQAEMQSKQIVISQIKDLLGENAPQGLEKYPKEQLQAYLAQQKQVFDQTTSQLQQEVIEAWEKAGMPKNKYLMGWAAAAMHSHLKRTGETLQASEAVSKVKTDFLNCVRQVASQMDAQAIQDLLGKEVVQKLRDFDIQRVEQQSAAELGASQGADIHSVNHPKEKKQLNQYEWRKAMGID